MKRPAFLGMVLLLSCSGNGAPGPINPFGGTLANVSETPPNADAIAGASVVTSALGSVSTLGGLSSKALTLAVEKGFLQKSVQRVLMKSGNSGFKAAGTSDDVDDSTCTETATTLDCTDTLAGSKGGDVTLKISAVLDKNTDTEVSGTLYLGMDFAQFRDADKCGDDLLIDGMLDCDLSLSFKDIKKDMAINIQGVCDTLKNDDKEMDVFVAGTPHAVGLYLTLSYVEPNNTSEDLVIDGVVRLDGVNYNYKDVDLIKKECK